MTNKLLSVVLLVVRLHDVKTDERDRIPGLKLGTVLKLEEKSRYYQANLEDLWKTNK